MTDEEWDLPEDNAGGGEDTGALSLPTLSPKRRASTTRPKPSGPVPQVLTGQVPVLPVTTDDRPGAEPEWPHCENHREVQHRDRKPPWCNVCGWNRGNRTEAAQYGANRFGV